MVRSLFQLTCPLSKRRRAAVAGALHAGAAARQPPPPPAAAATGGARARDGGDAGGGGGVGGSSGGSGLKSVGAGIGARNGGSGSRRSSDALHLAASSGRSGAQRIGLRRLWRGNTAAPVRWRGDTQLLGVSRRGWHPHLGS